MRLADNAPLLDHAPVHAFSHSGTRALHLPRLQRSCLTQQACVSSLSTRHQNDHETHPHDIRQAPHELVLLCKQCLVVFNDSAGGEAHPNEYDRGILKQQTSPH
jgi:hypothetical protein